MPSGAIDWVPFILKGCVLATLAFLFARPRLLSGLLKQRLSARDQMVASLFFFLIGFAEVVFPHVRNDNPLLNLRIVAVSVSGLLAGPQVGLLIGFAITALAIWANPLTDATPIGISMIAGGLFAGLLHDWKPLQAARPIAGFIVGATISLFRDNLKSLWQGFRIGSTFEAAILQGLAVALVLFVIEQARAHALQQKTAAMAEVRALQARMNPHFLFNGLNAISALSEVDPGSVPKASANLGRFLRASVDRDDQDHITLEEELKIVDAYLEIEKLRMGDRLEVRRDVDPSLLSAKIPPFLIQPLVENAVRHGIQAKPSGGTVWIVVRESNSQLLFTISDDGVGFRPSPAVDDHVHALDLLRRRLTYLHGPRFRSTIQSDAGSGTVVFMQIPLERVEVLA